MESIGFTNKQAAEALEMKPATVSYYTNHGYVTPDIANPKGRGTTRRYSIKNLTEILLTRTLVDCGISLNSVKSLLAHLKNDRVVSALGFDPLDCGEPKTMDKEIYLTIYDDASGPGKMFFDVRWPGDQAVLDIPLHNKRTGEFVKSVKAVHLSDILRKVRMI